jgi:hypothetical protein
MPAHRVPPGSRRVWQSSGAYRRRPVHRRCHRRHQGLCEASPPGVTAAADAVIGEGTARALVYVAKHPPAHTFVRTLSGTVRCCECR